MSDNNSNYEVNIRTTAELKGVKEVRKEVQGLAEDTTIAIKGTKQITVAHGEAGEAAEGHAKSNSTLRLASRGANDAAFALADFLNGNYTVAFHRAKFAAEDLGIAMKTAFAPTAAVVGITLAVEALGYLVSHSGDQAEEAAKKHAELAKQMAEANKAEMERIKALADAEIASLHNATAEATSLLKALDEIAKSADKGRTELDRMTDAQAELDAARVDKEEAEKMAASKDDVGRAIIKRDADRQRAAIKAQAESEKLVRQQQAAEQEVGGAIRLRDQTANENDRAQDDAAAANEELQQRQRDAEAANKARVELEQQYKRLSEQEERLRVPGMQESPEHLAVAAAVGKTFNEITEAKQHEDATQKELDKAFDTASRMGTRAANLAGSISDLQKKVKEANDKLTLANYQAETHSIKSGLAAGAVEKAGDEAVLAANKKAAEEAEKARERQRQASIAANTQSAQDAKNQIAALELHAKSGKESAQQLQTDAARILELKKKLIDLETERKGLEHAVSQQPTNTDRDAGLVALAELAAGKGSGASNHGTAPALSGLHGSLTSGGLESGALTTGHLGGASYAETDFAAAFKPRIDTRPQAVRNGEQDMKGLDGGEVASILSGLKDDSASGTGQTAQLISIVKQLVEHTKNVSNGHAKNAGEIEQLKRETDNLSSQIKNGRR